MCQVVKCTKGTIISGKHCDRQTHSMTRSVKACASTSAFVGFSPISLCSLARDSQHFATNVSNCLPTASSPRHSPCNMALTLLPWDVGKHVPNEMLPYIHRSWASTALMPKAGLSSFSIRAHSVQKTPKKTLKHTWTTWTCPALGRNVSCFPHQERLCQQAKRNYVDRIPKKVCEMFLE